MKGPISTRRLLLIVSIFSLAAPLAAQEEINLDALGATPTPSPGPASDGSINLDDLGAPTAPSASGEVNLDDLGAGSSGPAPSPPVTSAPARSRLSGGSDSAGPKVNLNLYADFDAEARWTEGQPAAASFLQNHTAVLLKGLYGGDQASMLVDALHPGDLFDLGINGSLLGRGFTALPILGTSSWRFGRILVPFGDYEFHHLYGGYVDESNLLFNKLWSDLGIAWKLQPAEGLETELFVGNGFGPDGTGQGPDFSSSPSPDANLAKALDLRVRWAPTPASFLLVSGYWDSWGPEGTSGRNLVLGGLDAGNKWGPLGLKAGGFGGWVAGVSSKDWFRWAWYAEAKYTLDSDWALRLRGGQRNPDSRVRDTKDQWDVNAAVLWTGGPIAVEMAWFLNRQSYNTVTDPENPSGNSQVLLLKFLLTI